MEPEEVLLAEVRGFMRSRVILTAAEGDLFTHLHQAALSARELARTLGLDERATTRVLDCLITFGLLQKEEDRYSVTAKGAFLSARHPDTILPMVLHLNELWESWSDLTATVKNGPGTRKRASFDTAPERQKAFIGAMHVVGRTMAPEIAAAYDLSSFRHLLDIGGGSGTYTIAFLKKNPLLQAILFDLDSVIPMAEERLRAEGLRERVKLAGGDFYIDELPRGCDVALLSAIIHQNSPAENLDLFGRIYRALEPGGVLLVRDHIMDESRTNPPEGALFALNMLVNTTGGDTYTFQEVKQGLEAVGFRDVTWLRVGKKMDSLVEARKSR